MTATWNQDVIDLLIKMTAGLENISNYGLNMVLYYTDADFSWPDLLDDWTSRAENVVTVQRTALCETFGIVRSMRGVMSGEYNGLSITEPLIEKTYILWPISVGETAKPKMSIRFTR